MTQIVGASSIYVSIAVTLGWGAAIVSLTVAVVPAHGIGLGSRGTRGQHLIDLLRKDNTKSVEDLFVFLLFSFILFFLISLWVIFDVMMLHF